MKNKSALRTYLVFVWWVSVALLITSCSVISPGGTPKNIVDPPIPTLTPTIEKFYYVDANSGSDANPGSEALPWQTIQKAAQTLLTGEKVIVRSGIYPERVIVEGSRLTFIAQENVQMRGFDVRGNYNLISGFNIQNPDNNSGLRVSGNYNTFEYNEISNTLQDGIWFFGHDNIFRHNYIHDIWLGGGSDPDPHVDCFQTWSWEVDTYNILFEGNICNHTRTSGSNQIVMISGDGSQAVRDISFRNNIFIMHDAGYSPLAVYGSGFVSNIKVHNNTFYNVTTQGTPAIYMVDVNNAEVLNNVSIGYSQIAEITGNDNLISHNVWEGDYGMVDFRRFDFHLLPDSPLIDAGISIDEVSVDFEKVNRPQGNGFDIGAYEYQE